MANPLSAHSTHDGLLKHKVTGGWAEATMADDNGWPIYLNLGLPQLGFKKDAVKGKF